ncbi:MAG: hypothetical protein PHQ80_01160 [Candidatus ainarchaeum sp.]|nr:hypothetical protein [Candidatus ainarchaeum sp.]
MDKKLKLGIFLVLFSVLSFAFSTVNLSYIVGSQQQSFTMFQFAGPVGGGIMGPGIGALSAIAVDFASKLFLGKFAWDAISFIRLFTVAAAAVCFGMVRAKKWAGIAIPLAGMLLFWLNPVGAEAWGYAFLWLIPIVATFFASNLFMRSLASTFQAHVVGSIAFLYLIGLPAAAWWALIPLVLVERCLFASGMCVTYVSLNSIIALVQERFAGAGFVRVEPAYSLVRVK